MVYSSVLCVEDMLIMAGIRASIIKRVCGGLNPTTTIRGHCGQSSYMLSEKCTEFSRYGNRAWNSLGSVDDVGSTREWKTKTFSSVTYTSNVLTKCHFSKVVLRCPGSLLPTCTYGMPSIRAYSSNAGGKDGVFHESGISASGSNDTNMDGSDWASSLKLAYQSVLDTSTYAKQKAEEVSHAVLPHIQQQIDSHPFLKDVIVPVSGTFFGTLLAWLLMPRLLRRLHKYTMQGPVTLLYGTGSQKQLPYEKSVWGALEDPVRYLITFMAFLQLAALVAPTTIASQYLGPAWRGAVVISFVWFLHRWKTNVFARALASQNIVVLDRERLLALDKLSSAGLYVIGLMATAEACGVAVQSILTVGGIGGVATAFAARDILGNMLSGLSMQFSKPFSIGDTIKAGSIEGQVVEIGLTMTSLLNSEKFPVLVPNSLFSSQVIVNKTRAQWRAMVTKIPLQVEDLEKIPPVSEDIKAMLRSYPKVFLGKEAPYCFLSRIESSFAELTVGCNLKHMSREELYSSQQDILLQAVRIIKKHGGKV